MEVLIKKLHKDAVIPAKAHGDDFCYDCVATSCVEIAPNVYKYGLGFALQMVVAPILKSGIRINEHSFSVDLRARSSIWRTGMVLSNGVGTIDEGYRGEVSAVFYHVMPDMPKYKVGDRICQIHFNATSNIDFILTDQLDKTERGVGGYGSTGA